MESDENRIAAALVRRVGQDAEPAQIAAAMVATWQAIDDALYPIIGKGGVAALYKRSLHLSGAAHPWLGSAHDGGQAAIDFTRLQAVLEQQTSAKAAVGGSALLQTFSELLASLIGPSLTERLLRSVMAIPSSGPIGQEPAR